MSLVLSNSSKRITQSYGKQKNGSFHYGVDLGMSINKEDNVVYPNCKGIVIEVRDGLKRMPGSTGVASWGNYVLIKHNNGMYSRYAHLKSGVLVKKDQIVDVSSKLGIMGDSGNTTGSHLHFEVQKDYSSKTRIDPTIYLTKPIDEESSSLEKNGMNEIIYVVCAGDTLSSIGYRYNISWQELASYNQIKNPNLIYPGNEIRIPCKQVYVAQKYIVKKGDNLSKIAKKFNTTWQKIYMDNKDVIDNTAKNHGVGGSYQNFIYEGEVLHIKQ